MNVIKEFADWIKDIAMVTIAFREFEYTWSNNRVVDKRVCTKTDHMFCNDHSKNLMPHLQLDYEASIFSGHSPRIFTIQSNLKFGLKPFKFMSILNDS